MTDHCASGDVIRLDCVTRAYQGFSHAAVYTNADM
jgi:hypothetical protein